MSSDILSIGIDFGTTNSSMAWYNPNTQQAEIIRNAEGEDKTPSLVYFGEEEILVGKSVDDLIEQTEDYDDPSEREDVNQRVVKSIKRSLLNPPIIPIPGREPVRPVEVVAEILRKLKRDAEEEHFQQEVERAVITCPAVFSVQEWEVVFEAAIKAGFGRVERLEEPTAAALAVARLGQRVGSNVLVYDLGAGTFDLSVIARDEEDGSFYVPMVPQGDPQCGGDDLDLALYNHCEKLAQDQLGRSISVTGGIDLAFLRQCRSRKESLSVMSTSKFSSYLPSEKGSERFRYEVDRETFEGLIRPLVEDTAKKTSAVVERAKEQDHEVATVVLIGGSSRVPLVAQLLGETLPVKPRNFAEKDYAVALGAAYRGHDLWSKRSKKGATRERGRVKWFDAERGYGFLERPIGEDLFLHHTEVLGAPSDLTPDEEVEYEVGQTDKGPIARNVQLVQRGQVRGEEPPPPTSSPISAAESDVSEQRETSQPQEREQAQAYGFISVRSKDSKPWRLFPYTVFVDEESIGQFISKKPTPFKVPAKRCEVRVVYGKLGPVGYGSNILTLDIGEGETKDLVCSFGWDQTLRLREE